MSSLLAGLLAATIVLGRWRGGEFREIYEQLRHRAGWVDRDIECRLQPVAGSNSPAIFARFAEAMNDTAEHRDRTAIETNLREEVAIE